MEKLPTLLTPGLKSNTMIKAEIDKFQLLCKDHPSTHYLTFIVNNILGIDTLCNFKYSNYLFFARIWVFLLSKG